VTSPGRALALVFYLFLVTVAIYASFGMAHFADALQVRGPRIPLTATSILNKPSRKAPLFVPNAKATSVEHTRALVILSCFDHARPLCFPKVEQRGSDGARHCRSLLGCFYVLFYGGLSDAGNLKNFLATANPGAPVYLKRIAFDSIFFIWVGIILLNIITGLMVDTFSRLREEKKQRNDTLEHECFVCGLTRGAYEDLTLASAAVAHAAVPPFDAHVGQDHDLWAYVHYVAYLGAKDPTEDSGIESFVRAQVAHHLLEWVPSRTSYALQQAKIHH